MSQYGETVTKAGRNLLTKIIANKASLVLTRARVGRGISGDDTDPRELNDLIDPLHDATTTEPIPKDGTVAFIVEYRSDMNGGLKESFWLSEYGIYARDPDAGEILLFYGTLGDLPQPVNAYQNDGRVDARRFPVSIVVGIDTEVKLEYVPGAYITADEAKELIAQFSSKIYLSKIQPENLRPGDLWAKELNRHELQNETEILLQTRPYDPNGEYGLKIDDKTETVDNIGDGKELNIIMKDKL